MLNPLLSAVLRRPELFAEHAANYGALIRDELSAATRSVIARLIAGVVAGVSALTALGLVGTAVMLGVLHGQFAWVLVIVPGIAILLAALGAWVAFRPVSFHGFGDLRNELKADAQAFQLARERTDG